VEQKASEDTIQVLDHGFVRLDDAMASDLSVVNAARVSFARRKEEMEDADAGLIRFLMRERHGTPFEHNAFRFHIRAPIFVAREWFRHRIGSFNEFSMRYAMATDEFYVPAREDVRTQVGKPGAYSFEPVTDEVAQTTRDELAAVYAAAFAAYERLVEMGVARELARAVMPVGAYTEFYWTASAPPRRPSARSGTTPTPSSSSSPSGCLSRTRPSSQPVAPRPSPLTSQLSGARASRAWPRR